MSEWSSDNRFQRFTKILTVGDLRKILEGVPDTVPIIRKKASKNIYNQDVQAALGMVPIGYQLHKQECLRVSV